jgi:hypothetical protein
MGRGRISEDFYIPSGKEVTLRDAINAELVMSAAGPFLLMPGASLIDAIVEGASLWKEMGGTSAGLAALLNGMLPAMLPEILVTACAKFGIPEAIAHSLAMMVVMPLLAGILPKLVDRIVDEVWALGANEPPPTYLVEGTATVIANGETMYINFSQTIVGEAAPLPFNIVEML